MLTPWTLWAPVFHQNEDNRTLACAEPICRRGIHGPYNRLNVPGWTRQDAEIITACDPGAFICTNNEPVNAVVKKIFSMGLNWGWQTITHNSSETCCLILCSLSWFTEHCKKYKHFAVGFLLHAAEWRVIIQRSRWTNVFQCFMPPFHLIRPQI